MQLERKEFKCVLCAHKWLSRLAHPQQCPGCKRKDWDGKHNSLGRPLDKHGRAVAAVAPVVGGSDGGGGVAAECECAWCGHEWVSRVGRPQQCPACKRRGWDESNKPVTLGRSVPAVCEWWCGLHFKNGNVGEMAGVCPWCMTDMTTGEVIDGKRRTTREQLWSDLKLTVGERAAAIKAAVKYTELWDLPEFTYEDDGIVIKDVRYVKMLLRPSDGTVLEVEGAPVPGAVGADGFDFGGVL